MAVGSITNSLGVGSGIDVQALVEGLVDAQFATKNSLLDQREETLTAQVSSAAELKNAITGFSNALATLVSSGTLSTQPTSSDSSVLKTSLLAGGSATNLNASVEVRQIAQAQASNSGLVAAANTPFETGKLTLTFGSATVEAGVMTDFIPGSAASIDITIGQGDATLSGIAAAINAKKAGVTASIVSDTTGARLVLKGATGDSQAFTLTAVADPAASPAPTPAPASLASLEVGTNKPATIGTQAQDAIVAIDGVAVRRQSNSIEDLVPGIRLGLVTAKPGTLVQVGTTPPTEGLSQAVQDFVAAYNELQSMLATATDPKEGSLRADPAARALKSQLSQLASTVLTSDTDGPRTLAEIGVSTNRDGTLGVDTTRLNSALSANLQAVESMFSSTSGLPASLRLIALSASSRTTGLGASETRYSDMVADVSEQREKALEAAEAMRTRMTQQFASMDAKVAAYKSTQSFLEQQIAAWNNTND
ncbi:flagellar filament capping protein FliD [Sphingomonas sp. IW22]|uniref:flagellar filament capping protein FliD n=1 Tax=Sphingomonas sp. IW22 TaxID=3242489 RepID=UPI0035213474